MTEPKKLSTNPEDSAPATPPAAEDIRADANSKIGYGQQPKQHCVQKGKSGNPRGRPKKVKPFRDTLNMPATLTKVFAEPVRVPIDGKIVEMTAFEAMCRASAHRAIRKPWA